MFYANNKSVFWAKCCCILILLFSLDLYARGSEVRIKAESGVNNYIIVPTAEELINSKKYKEGTYVKTLGYYKENDGGGGIFMIQKRRPIKSETVLYYTLANGLYANCIDAEVVLPRYGGVFVNEMLDNAKPFLRSGVRDVIVLPSSNINHPGCSKYVSGSGARACFWQVNAPVLFDDRCSYSEIFFHDEIVVAPEVSSIEAVLKIAGPNKPEDITFVTPILVEGRHIDVNNTVVAEHGILIEDGARIIFGKLQASYAKNCITLGGGPNSNEVEFYASNVEASYCLEKGLNIDDNRKSIRFNIEKFQLQAPLGDFVTWIYAHGNISQSNIGTLFCSLAGATDIKGKYRTFDIVTILKTGQVIDFDRIRISQCSEFGIIEGGLYEIGSLVLTAIPNEAIDIKLGRNTKVLCDYIKMENSVGEIWKVSGVDTTSYFQVRLMSKAPISVSKEISFVYYDR